MEQVVAGAMGAGPVVTKEVLWGVASSGSTLGFSTTVVMFKFKRAVLPRFPPPVVTVGDASSSGPGHFPVSDTVKTAMVATASVGAPATRDGVITGTGTTGAHFSPGMFVVTLRVMITTPILVDAPSGAPTMEVQVVTNMASLAPSIVAFAISIGNGPPGGPPAVTPTVGLWTKSVFFVVGEASAGDPVGTPVTIVRGVRDLYFVVIAFVGRSAWTSLRFAAWDVWWCMWIRSQFFQCSWRRVPIT